MVEFICTVCGYVHNGDGAPATCPQCSAPEARFKPYGQEKRDALADEHRVGIAKGVDGGVFSNLRMEFATECAEVGTYLAMSRQADREGYPEIAAAFQRVAMEEAEHAAKLAELLGETLTSSTKTNLERRMEAEFESNASKKKLATNAKQLNLDAIHDKVHEMSKDEGRHYRMFQGLLERYFDKK